MFAKVRASRDIHTDDKASSTDIFDIWVLVDLELSAAFAKQELDSRKVLFVER